MQSRAVYRRHGREKTIVLAGPVVFYMRNEYATSDVEVGVTEQNGQAKDFPWQMVNGRWAQSVEVRTR